MTTIDDTDRPLRDARSGPNVGSGEPVLIRALGRVERAMARIAASGLDARLARGVDPATSRLLRLRAAQLTSPLHRAELADAWMHVLDRAGGTETLFDARVPVARAAVLDAAPQIVALVQALRSAAPVPPGTVARAHVLLSDGTSAVYTGGDLAVRVRGLVADLGPHDA